MNTTLRLAALSTNQSRIPLSSPGSSRKCERAIDSLSIGFLSIFIVTGFTLISNKRPV